jgi:hypothetical protein
MTYEEFVESLEQTVSPEEITAQLRALWWERKGDWERAHGMVQDMMCDESSWIHAYLHRREGDLDNAGYWYRLAKRPPSTDSLDEEWEEIVLHCLKLCPC